MALEGDLKALLSPLFSGGVHPVVNNGKTINYPYATYFNVSGSAVTIHSSGTKQRRIQIDIFANSYGEAKRLYAQAETALENSSITCAYITDSDAWEETPGVYRQISEYYMWA